MDNTTVHKKIREKNPVTFALFEFAVSELDRDYSIWKKVPAPIINTIHFN